MQSREITKEISYNKLSLALGFGLLLFLGDRLIKHWSAGSINNKGGFFYYFENTNGVFSLPLPVQFLISLAAVALVVIVWLGVRFYQRRDLLKFFAAILMLIGGVSNLLDRTFVGAVVDVWHLYNLSFNLADLYLIIGLGLMIG